MKRLLEVLLIALFLFPFGVLLMHFQDIAAPDAVDVLPFLKSAMIQATLSGLFSLLFATCLAIGLMLVNDPRRRQWLEIFFLIPGIVPGIFIVLSVLQLYSLFGVHPMGYLGVVTANVAMSYGIVGVFLERAFHEKVGGFAELARVEGARPLKTFLTLAPLMRRDLMAMFFAVFIFSFLGFSVPLILGGLEAATLEVQIYRKVVSEGALSEALTLSVLQLLFIAVCSLMVPLRQGAVTRKTKMANLTHLGSPILLLVFIALTGCLLLAPMTSIGAGLKAIFKNDLLSRLIVQGGIGTMVISFMAGVFTLLLSAAVTFVWPPKFLSRFFFAYSAPSAVLIGFGFYMSGYHLAGLAPQIAFLGPILGIFFWPSLFRISLYGSAAGLEGQIEVARQMGAGPLQIFRQVTWPQVRGSAAAMAALSALWGAGDFGITSMLTVEDTTLSLLVKNLISRYRLAEATVVLWILILVAVFIALIFVGVNRVVDRKSSLSA